MKQELTIFSRSTRNTTPLSLYQKEHWTSVQQEFINRFFLIGYMSHKSRGTNAERDLIHKFWGSGWAALRAAGSGSSQFPAPDIVCSNNVRKLAIEVKLTTESRKYFTKKEIRELTYFSEKFGAESWVGIKFFHIPWRFLTVEDLQETPSAYCVSKELAELRGLTFEELVSL